MNKLLLYALCLTPVPFAFAQDELVSLVYAPVIQVTPAESQLGYPSSVSVKLLINQLGRVEQVFYPKNTLSLIKDKVDGTIKTAKFTPYKRNGQPVKSIVPYTITFYVMDDIDYAGDAD